MNTRSSLSFEMDNLRRELTMMAVRVEEDLDKALAVLRSGAEELVNEVKESGKIVDSLQLKIEETAFVIIATQQPVARDLRELIMIFKITASLERIGDYGIHLAKAAVKLSRRPPFRSLERIERMAETGLEMLKAALSAYTAQDAGTAREAAVLDQVIDKEHEALTEEVLKLMKKNPELVKPAARLLRLSGYMERLGDHITNICEEILFMIEGKHEELNG